MGSPQSGAQKLRGFRNNSAYSPHMLREHRDYSALFPLPCTAKIIWRKHEFRLKTVKDDGSLRVGGITIEVYTSNVM